MSEVLGERVLDFLELGQRTEDAYNIYHIFITRMSHVIGVMYPNPSLHCSGAKAAQGCGLDVVGPVGAVKFN